MSIEDTLNKSYFLGRDGYRYWIGKIPVSSPPTSSVWGERVPVRILGYHTSDTSVLPDEDLPRALIKKPTTAGADNGQSSGIVGGEIVTGYFLDSDDAQQPIIDGILDRWDNTIEFSTQELLDGADLFKAGPLFNYNNYPAWRIVSEGKNPDPESLSSEQGKTANPTGKVGVTQVRDDTERGYFVPSSFDLRERSILDQQFNGPNNCGDDIVSRIRVEISKLVTILQGVKKYYNTYVIGSINKVYDFIGQIEKVIESIAAVMRSLIQRIRNYVLRKIRELLSKALEIILGDVLKDIRDAVINEILDIIFCIFQTTIEDLPNLIGDFVAALLGRISASPLCAAEQFINSLVNNVINSIQGVLDPIIEDIEDLIDGVLDIGSAVSSAIDQVLGLVGFLCLEKNCLEVTKFNSSPWGGPTAKNVDDYNKFLSQLNVPPIVDNAVAWLNEAGLTDDGFSSCDLTPENCGPPVVSIFGGNPTSEALAAAVVSQNGSIIGTLITNRGLGYRYPPFITFDDPCGNGSGAGGYTTLNDDGSIQSIVITNGGWGYYPGPDGSTTFSPSPDASSDIGGGSTTTPTSPVDGGSETTPGTPGTDGDGSNVVNPNPNPDTNPTEPVGPSDPDQIITIPVVGCLDEINIISTGFGYSQDDEIVITPEKPGLTLTGRYTDSGQIVEIIIEGEVCGFTEIPEIQINSKTGAGAVLRPVLSFTKITDFSEQEVVRYQNSTLSVVQCIPR